MRRVVPLLLPLFACVTPSTIASSRAALTTDDGEFTLICRIEPKETPDAGHTLPPDSGVGPADGGVDAGTPAPTLTFSLTTSGNRILLPDGKPAQLRGVNAFDPRMCSACAGATDWTEVRRKLTIAVVDWKATFIRLNLEEAASANDAYFTGLLATVRHLRQYPGVYIAVSVWSDSVALTSYNNGNPNGGPNAATAALWTRLATLLRDEPNAVLSISNEPRRYPGGEAEAWTEMKRSLDAIRAAEDPAKRHLVLAQGLEDWGRRLGYYVTHPLGPNVAYAAHLYDPPGVFEGLLAAGASLPVVIEEFGAGSQTGGATEAERIANAEKVIDYAEAHGLPWLAWSYTRNCPPDLIANVSANSRCSAGTWTPSAWGSAIIRRLGVR